ncbi:MAG: ATP-binding protein [Chitinispirillales bacterium]|nr:ATP-binding protein [Chitinispirillales bacterium]
MENIARKEDLDFLIRSRDRHIIKVVSGVRRCGKSTLFDLYREYLLKNGVKKNQIIVMNFEDLEYEHIRSYRKLYDHVKKLVKKNEKNYIFLDEIQHVKDFEKAVDSLFIHKNTDLYITGSNAYFMSGELATLLSGRYIELKMFPFSFSEYCEGYSLYRDKNASLQKMFNGYIQESSFPYALQLNGSQKEISDYLNGIYSSVLLKDVVARHKIADVMMLESVVKFVFDSIGSPISSTKIANTMGSHGRKIDNKTVEKYLHGLTDSLILYHAKRFDIKGKQHLATLGKYFVVDIGLRNILLGHKFDIGHILENIVYLELLRRNYQVSVGVIDGCEVDFVAKNHEGLTYVQVAATVRNSETLSREIRPLNKIKDNHPKLLLTLDDDPDTQIEGIQKINAVRWLARLK